jgi:hypothetical protein
VVAVRARDNASGVNTMQITSNARKPGYALRFRAKTPFKTTASGVYLDLAVDGAAARAGGRGPSGTPCRFSRGARRGLVATSTRSRAR